MCDLWCRKSNDKRSYIPPKAIFDKPRPNDLITVPACDKCNNGNSENDEKFKVYLGLHVAMNGINSSNLFQEVKRTLKHNKKLKREIFAKFTPVDFVTKSGIYTGEKGTSVLWDSEVHDKTINRIVKGLYYHHYRKVLQKEAEIYWFREPLFFEELKKCYSNSIAEKPEDVEGATMW
jgi:hypothetical protein